MDWRAIAAAALLLAPALMISEPEAASPGSEISADAPYAKLISQVQERLLSLGFDAGPVNGDFGSRTQAALAQFQLANNVPVSGQLDDATLAELGVERGGGAAAGASSEPEPGS